jgi:glyoxylase-like metal-dependent hydrolase (beta-lactamase superfamily II)
VNVDDLPVIHRWFAAEDAGDGVTRLIETHVDPFLESNVWHVRGSERDLIVDAANGIGALRPSIDALDDGRPVIAVVTHAHFDHVGGLHEFEDRRCHRADAQMPNPAPLRLMRKDFPDWLIEDYAWYDSPLPQTVALRGLPYPGFDPAAWTTPAATASSFLAEGDVVDLGDRAFTVLHTPGHTPGSICLWDERDGVLFSGDAIYVDARLGWEDPAAFGASLERLRDLDARIVHSGHGRSFDGAELREAVESTLRDLS